METPIHYYFTFNKNEIYIKREDFIPFSFGGNKARKAILFFEEIDKGEFDTVVTYGSSSSNHARIVANAAKKRGLKCYIISPKEASEATFNSKIMEFLDAEIITVPVKQVSSTIDDTLTKLKEKGHNPYFIQGGGHGDIGTKAYIQCYEEILNYERMNGDFDYIFLASGTGTTQAGLVLGKLINKSKKTIVGISVARTNPRGRSVVIESAKGYCDNNNIQIDEDEINNNVIFLDDYICGAYGNYNDEILELIKVSFQETGIPLNSTYTGKALYGMREYISKEKIVNKKILFINTGGEPLFFDYLNNVTFGG